MTRVLLLALLATTACKSSMRPPQRAQRVEEVPRWRTEKDTVRLEIIEKLLEGGDPIRALHLLQQMRDEGVDRPEMALFQGIALRQQGMYDDAERLMRQAQDDLPKDGRVYEALCVLYADSDRVPEAIIACERSTELDEDDAAAWNNLGFLLLASDPERSRTALQRAVDLQPTSVRYRNNLAFAQAAAGDHRAALKTFLTTGTPADAHYNVGAAFERRGERDRAASYYERALQYDADHSYADGALRRLRSEPPAEGDAPPAEEN